MLYSYLVKKLVRQSFENVNNHRYNELLKAVDQMGTSKNLLAKSLRI